jgi:hypothetical protein
MARNMKVCTITTTSNLVSNASNPLTLIGVEKTPTPSAKKPKTVKTFSTKSAKKFQSIGDIRSTSFNDFDVDGCNIYEVILFFKKLSLSPNASSMNVAFTKHIFFQRKCGRGSPYSDFVFLKIRTQIRICGDLNLGG